MKISFQYLPRIAQELNIIKRSDKPTDSWGIFALWQILHHPGLLVQQPAGVGEVLGKPMKVYLSSHTCKLIRALQEFLLEVKGQLSSPEGDQIF